MTKGQRCVLATGLLLLASVIIFPPYECVATMPVSKVLAVQRGFLWAPPTDIPSDPFSDFASWVIDYRKIVMEGAAIGCFAGVALLLFRKKRQRPPKGE